MKKKTAKEMTAKEIIDRINELEKEKSKLSRWLERRRQELKPGVVITSNGKRCLLLETAPQLEPVEDPNWYALCDDGHVGLILPEDIEMVHGKTELVNDAVDFLKRPNAAGDMPILQRWIPRNERTPEEDGLFLATIATKNGGVPVKYTEISEWLRFEEHFDDDNCETQVTAWMPLPEPYEGGNENDD